MEPDNNAMNEPATRRARLRVAYNGGAFHGFADNEGVNTVAGTLIAALRTVLRCDVEISMAGRTDAGVHARGQVISFDAPAATDLSAMVRSINAICAPHIAVSEPQWTGSLFDARSSATWRHYKYTVLNTPEPDPMLIDRVWHVYQPLSVELMNLACDGLMGEQDLAAFCRRPPVSEGHAPASLKRYVMQAKWTSNGDGTLTFDIRANAFCHQMVRSIVGFLVDVGARKRPPSDTRAVLYGRDRSHGSQVAPPQGLSFWEVGYDGVRVHTPNPRNSGVGGGV